MNWEDAVKNLCVQICAGLLLTITTAALAQAQPAPQPPAGTGIPVTADNFVRAETDKTFASFEKQNAFSKFLYFRDPVANRQPHRPARQPRHALFGRRVRPRCRTGDDLAARRWKALYDDDRDR